MKITCRHQNGQQILIFVAPQIAQQNLKITVKHCPLLVLQIICICVPKFTSRIETTTKFRWPFQLVNYISTLLILFSIFSSTLNDRLIYLSMQTGSTARNNNWWHHDHLLPGHRLKSKLDALDLTWDIVDQEWSSMIIVVFSFSLWRPLLFNFQSKITPNMPNYHQRIKIYRTIINDQHF